MPLIQMPDGAVVDMPETLTSEQRAALEAKVNPGLGARIGRQAKLAGSAALQGVAGLPALAMEVGEQFTQRFKPAQVVSTMANVVRQKAGLPINAEQAKFGDRLQGVQGGAEELFGKPETPGEHYMTEGIKGALGALVGGGAAAPVRAMIAGASGGLGGELAARVGGDNALTRVGGALAGTFTGAGLANFVAGVRPQLRKLAEEAYRGLDDAVLHKAEALQAKSLQEGVQLDLAQALDAVGAPSSSMTKIRDILANSKAGPRIQQLLEKDQPVQLKNLVDQTILELPGTVRHNGPMANIVADTATDAVRKAEGARSALWKHTFEESAAKTGVTEVPQHLHDDVVKMLRSAADQFPNTPRQVLAQRLVKKLVDENGLPITNGLQLNEILKAEASRLKSPKLSTKGVDRATVGWMNEQIQNTRRLFGDGLKPFRDANATYGPFTESVVEPLKRGPVGQLAGIQGARPDVQASVAKLRDIFTRGVDPNATGTSEVLTLARELKKVDPEVFPDAVKTHWSRTLGDAFEAAQGGVPGTSGKAANILWETTFKTPAQMKQVTEMAAGVATSYGLPAHEVVRGLKNLAIITRALKVRPETIGGLQAKEIVEMGGSNRLAHLARVFSFIPAERIARKVEDAQLARTLGRFDEVLTSPEGARMLIELGKQAPLSPEAAVLLSGFAGNLPQPAKELAPQ